MMNRIHKDMRRLPAEWEPYEGVMLAWPHEDTDWAYMLDEVQKTVVNIAEVSVRSGLKVVVAGPNTDAAREAMSHLGDSVLYLDVPTNDTWTRDYGVISCQESVGSYRLCDFKFNGWGLKYASDRDNLVTLRMVESKLLNGTYENHLGFVLEGGSIESDGKGTILTTSRCLESLNRNGNMCRRDIEQYLERSLGASRVLWIDHGYLAGDDTDSHIDTLARLVSDDTIVYVKCDDPADEHYAELGMMEQELMALRTVDGYPYHLVGLPMPDAVYDEDGMRLPATYANFLITPRTVLLPVYGQPQKDLLAEQILGMVFPGRDILTVNCSSLIKQHGSLHCMTMQIPHTILPV